VRRKHLSRRAALARECLALYHPLAIDFTSCSLDLREHLIHYERARDDRYILECVSVIRSGSADPSSYWKPNKDFGPPAWPLAPFLTVSPEEWRKRSAVPDIQPDPWLRALPVLRHGSPPGHPVTKLPLEISHGSSRDDLLVALSSVLEAYQLGKPSRPPAKSGRHAPRRGPLEVQMRGIALTRLRTHFSAAETLELLESTGWAGSFSAETHLDRAWRNAKKDRYAFSLLARKAITEGHWFFPFRNAFLTI
jgi:hypothetical protein